MSVDDTCIGFDDLHDLIVDSTSIVMSSTVFESGLGDVLTFAVCKGPAMPGGHTDVIVTVTSLGENHAAAVVSRDECNRLAMLFTRAVRDWPT